MTVAANEGRKTFTGDSVTTSFATTPVEFFDTSDLDLYVVTTATSGYISLTEGVHYTVTGGDGSTGTIDTTGGSSPHGTLLTGTKLVIVREVPETQTDNFVNNDINDAEVLEERLDRLTLMVQRLSNRLDRAVHLHDAVASDTIDLLLPTPTASQYLAWNSSADALVNVASVTVGAVNFSAFGTSLVDDANAAAGRATLGAVGLTGDETIAGAKTFSGAIVASTTLAVTGTTTLTGALTAAGTAYIGDTANANATLGLTINQGAADDEILSLKSSDVAHGVTNITETDTYAAFQKLGGTSGGLRVDVLVETGATNAFVANAYCDNPTTTASTTAAAAILMQHFSYSGASVADVPANSLVFGVKCRKGGSTQGVFYVDEDGDLFNDGASGTSTTYDTYNDAALARAFDQAVAPGAVIRSQWDEHVNYKREDLVRAGILTDPKDGGRGMVNITQLQRLHNGAIWQLYTKMQEQAKLIAEQANELAGIKQKLLPA